MKILLFELDVETWTALCESACKEYKKRFLFWVDHAIGMVKDTSFYHRMELIQKMIAVSNVDTEATCKHVWSFVLSLLDKPKLVEIDEIPETMEGFVYLHKDQLMQLKEKYTRTVLDELIERSTKMHEGIVESNIVHKGVDRVIMKFL